MSREDRYIEGAMRNITILKLMTYPSRQWWGVTQLSLATGMNHSIVHRHLATLMYRGLVEQNAYNRQYHALIRIVWPDEDE